MSKPQNVKGLSGHSGVSRFLSNPLPVLYQAAVVKLPRAVPDSVLRYTCPDGPHPFVLKVPSRGKHLIPVYVFVPASSSKSTARDTNFPVVIDFHGGGFFMGSCLEQAPFCSLIARELNAVVISVDYRMGPIDKFPAATEDAEDIVAAVLNKDSKAYMPLREGIRSKLKKDFMRSKLTIEEYEKRLLDLTKVAVSGFSSGGNLALSIGQSINPPELSEAWPCRFPQDFPSSIPLLLFFPSLDARQLPSERPPKAGERPSLSRTTTASSQWSLSNMGDVLAPTYLPRDMSGHPRASPGLVPLSGLHKQAKMLLILPEVDTLAHQSEEWVKKVEEEGRGSDLQVERYPDMKHGWVTFPVTFLKEPELKTRDDAYTKTIAFLRQHWDVEAKA